MTPDIHSLDQYIGHYVVISEGHEGASGWLVDVSDDVKYDGGPHRWVSLDWGQGWPVRETTEIVLGQPPEGEPAPEVENPIQLIHQQMDGRPCADALCPNLARAPKVMRAIRVWQMKQSDHYWVHHYVKPLKNLLADPVSVGDLLRDARSEGAPPHILDRMQSLVNWHEKERRKA